MTGKLPRAAPLDAATRVAGALAAGAAGGFVFRLFELPLPWTLGAMAATAVLALAGPGWRLPAVFRDGARPVIGVMAGSAFSPSVVEQLAGWWQIIPILIAYFVLVSAAGQLFFRRVCGFDRPTALLASMPGGLGEMTLMGALFGADIRRLVLIHSVRIVTVVTAIPLFVTFIAGADLRRSPIPAVPDAGMFDWTVLLGCGLAGYLLGRRLRSWGGMMLAPMLFSALAHAAGMTSAAPPGWLIVAMQVVIGCISGSRFAGSRLTEIKLALLHGLAWTLLLLVMAAMAAEFTSLLLPLPITALFLAFAPGGFAEMTVIALAIQVEVGFVVACHAFRTLFVVTAIPLLSRALTRPRP